MEKAKIVEPSSSWVVRRDAHSVDQEAQEQKAPCTPSSLPVALISII